MENTTPASPCQMQAPELLFLGEDSPCAALRLPVAVVPPIPFAPPLMGWACRMQRCACFDPPKDACLRGPASTTSCPSCYSTAHMVLLIEPLGLWEREAPRAGIEV